MCWSSFLWYTLVWIWESHQWNCVEVHFSGTPLCGFDRVTNETVLKFISLVHPCVFILPLQRLLPLPAGNTLHQDRPRPPPDLADPVDSRDVVLWRPLLKTSLKTLSAFCSTCSAVSPSAFLMPKMQTDSMRLYCCSLSFSYWSAMSRKVLDYSKS